MGLWQRFKAWMGWGMGPSLLAERLRSTFEGLEGVRVRYQEARIPKRSGATRRLWIPNDETKDVQRRILRRLLAKLRVHPAAMGFEKGRSIVDNARPHVGRRVVVKMDVIDFFPNTKAERIERYFRRIGWSKRVARELTRLVTFEGGLPQGAPTSPRLSNLVNLRLDAELAGLASWCGGRYTRYADDITMSFGDEPHPIELGHRVRLCIRAVARALARHGYEAHAHRKLKILHRYRRQQVTGLVVNDALRLPRSTRRWLRAVRHRKATTGTCTLTDAQLAGWDAFEQMIARADTRPA